MKVTVGDFMKVKTEAKDDTLERIILEAKEVGIEMYNTEILRELETKTGMIPPIVTRQALDALATAKARALKRAREEI